MVHPKRYVFNSAMRTFNLRWKPFSLKSPWPLLRTRNAAPARAPGQRWQLQVDCGHMCLPCDPARQHHTAGLPTPTAYAPLG
jgi:hypothetical protein